MKKNDAEIKNKPSAKPKDANIKPSDKKKSTKKVDTKTSSKSKTTKIEAKNMDLNKKTICKGDLVSFIAHSSGQSQENVRQVLDTFIKYTTYVISVGGCVYISGFLRILTKRINRKTLTNPKTGEVVEVPTKNKVCAKAGKELKEAALQAPLAEDSDIVAKKPTKAPKATNTKK